MKNTPSTPPRALREIIIDDNVTDQDAITSWSQLQRFFLSQPKTREAPDLVFCDINFEGDQHSPLNNVHPKKPSGLLYALPFAALARWKGTPIVLKLLTWDNTLFSMDNPQRNTDAPPPSMRWLAAEVIGMLLPLLGITDTEVSTEEALQWLADRKNTCEGLGDARKSALKEYRIMLGKACRLHESSSPGLIIDPTGYDELVAWLTKAMTMSSDDKIPWHEDPGVVLLRSDGSRDSISVRSLFHTDDIFRIKNFLLQPRYPLKSVEKRAKEKTKSSGLEPPDDSWISQNGEVRMGEFVGFLGDWPRICRVAAEKIRNFSDKKPPSGKTIASEIPRSIPGCKMIRLVAMVYQCIRLHWYARNLWRRNYRDAEWLPRQLAFGNYPSDLDTLQQHLESAYQILCRYANKTKMPAGDLVAALTEDSWAKLDRSKSGIEGINNRDEGSKMRKKKVAKEKQPLVKWVQFHISLLEQMGLLGCDNQGYYQIRDPKRVFPQDYLPQCPSSLRPDNINSLIVGLAKSLGHDAGSAHSALGSIPAEALYGKETRETLLAGGGFLNDLKENILPGWLRELGREYARTDPELNWPEDIHWPPFLRG